MDARFTGIWVSVDLNWICSLCADDADVQMWMDQYVLNEPTYLHHVIFHFVFFMSLLVITHFVFVFYKLFRTTD